MAANCLLYHSVLDFRDKKANVTLTSSHIKVEHISFSVQNQNEKQNDCGYVESNPCQLIPLKDVIAVKQHSGTTTRNRFRFYDKGMAYQAVEMHPLHSKSFQIQVIRRAPKHCLRPKVMVFTCKDSASCLEWIEKIRDLLYKSGSVRPRHLLVFVNPYGGQKQGPKIFDKVRPLFELAGISLDVIETERQNHAFDVLQSYDLSSIDGLVSVGGDGTFSEVLNGLLIRCNRDEGIDQKIYHQPNRSQLHLGIIPAGSTDTIVFSTVGTIDPITSALQIITGDSIGVDVNALYKQEEFVRYSVTMTSYGYYGDLLADSEKLRWMGPRRYGWSGLKQFFLNKAYEGEVSFLPADPKNGHPQDGVVCYTGCEVCKRAGKESNLASKPSSTDVPTFDLGDSDMSVEENKEEWCRIEGTFKAINMVTISCKCSLTPSGMSPYTHLGNGCMDLILVSSCSRTNYLRHLTRISRPNTNQFDFSFVQVHRVREVKFQPAQDIQERAEGTADGESKNRSKSVKQSASGNSVWNCDGELVSHASLYVQVHCQLIKLFARGVEDLSKVKTETFSICETSCC